MKAFILHSGLLLGLFFQDKLIVTHRNGCH